MNIKKASLRHISKSFFDLTGPVGGISIMFPEAKFQNLTKVGSNDAYGSQTLKFRRAAK